MKRINVYKLYFDFEDEDYSYIKNDISNCSSDYEKYLILSQNNCIDIINHNDYFTHNSIYDKNKYTNRFIFSDKKGNLIVLFYDGIKMSDEVCKKVLKEKHDEYNHIKPIYYFDMDKSNYDEDEIITIVEDFMETFENGSDNKKYFRKYIYNNDHYIKNYIILENKIFIVNTLKKVDSIKIRNAKKFAKKIFNKNKKGDMILWN